MEEILDIEEIIDENLKEFMKKDEETEKLLNDKINEIIKEEEKLTSKENEIKSLEESNREKISTNASADELIEIAEKIKEVESEFSSINENIKKLSEEKEELLNTRNSIEASKQEYIKNLNSTNSNYEEQLKKISEAIAVCDNPTLKQVLADVEEKKTKELNDLQEKRISELKTVLKEEEEVKVDSIIIPEKEEEPISFDVSKIQDIDNSITFDIPFDQNIVMEETKEEPVIPEEVTPVIDNVVNNDESNMINLDSIMQGSDLVDTKTETQESINATTTSDKTKIIYEKDVPNGLLKDIYSSSKIMPALYDYLENKNVIEGSFN